MIPTTQSLIADLYLELADCESPLPVTVADSRICGFVVGINETLDFSYTFKHPEIDIEIGFMYPSRWDAFDLDPKEFAALDYPAQVRLVAKQARKQGFPIDVEGASWLEGRKGPDKKQALRKWLCGHFGHEGGGEADFLLDSTRFSPHLPGVAILAKMPKADAVQLGLREVVIASPASIEGAACHVDCTDEALNECLARHNLPFRVAKHA
jgi:hypothetical protein